jgi:hypothetical protein
MMQCFAVVQFGHAPSLEIRTLIKSRFRYDTERRLWEGGCSERQAQDLRPLLKSEGGTLRLFPDQAPLRR